MLHPVHLQFQIHFVRYIYIFQNRSGQNRTLKALLSSSSIYYTGITAALVKKAQGEFVLKPGQSNERAGRKSIKSTQLNSFNPPLVFIQQRTPLR